MNVCMIYGPRRNIFSSSLAGFNVLFSETLINVQKHLKYGINNSHSLALTVSANHVSNSITVAVQISFLIREIRLDTQDLSK